MQQKEIEKFNYLSVNFCSSVNNALSTNEVYLSYKHNLEP